MSDRMIRFDSLRERCGVAGDKRLENMGWGLLAESNQIQVNPTQSELRNEREAVKSRHVTASQRISGPGEGWEIGDGRCDRFSRNWIFTKRTHFFRDGGAAHARSTRFGGSAWSRQVKASQGCEEIWRLEGPGCRGRQCGRRRLVGNAQDGALASSWFPECATPLRFLLPFA